METNKLSEKEFGELFLAAYDGIREGPLPSGNDMPAFLETLAFSLAWTIDEKIGIPINVSTVLQQLLIIYTSDEGPEIAKDKEMFSVVLFQRLKYLDILPPISERGNNADREPIFKEIKDRFEAAHTALNGIGKKTESDRLPERISIGGSKDGTGSFKNAVATISDKLGVHGINLDCELLETFVSELIGQGHDINNPAKFILALIKKLKERGIIKWNTGGKAMLANIPPASSEVRPKLTFDLFKTAHDRMNVIGSVTFIQDMSVELASLCGLEESVIKGAIINVLFSLRDKGDGQKAQEILRKEPEHFYPLLMEELEKEQLI
jgi:hypothetical protein